MTDHAVAARLDLPPAYSLVASAAVDDAFAHACRIASGSGAGTFVWGRRPDLLDFAVVLEPDEPLALGRRAFLVGMGALADAVAAHCPPEKPLAIDWPDALQLDGARIGGGRLGWPHGCREDAVPDWLVFSAMLIASKAWAGDPGLTPGSTSLEEEGVGEPSRRAIAESFARHLMLAIDTWQDRGFAAAVPSYARRLSAAQGDCAIDPGGDLVLRFGNGRAGTRRALAPALATPSWLDPETGAVRL